jgi:hypothetical protein
MFMIGANAWQSNNNLTLIVSTFYIIFLIKEKISKIEEDFKFGVNLQKTSSAMKISA